MDQVVPDLTLESVMAKRFELVEQIAIIKGKHKGELEPLEEAVGLCERVIKDEMNKQGLQQLKTGAGMAFFTTKDSVTVEDFEEFIAHVIETGQTELLNKAANKTAVKEYLEGNKVLPPGIKYDAFRDLSWRRGKQ